MDIQEILVYNPKPGPRFNYVLGFIQSFFEKVEFVECNSIKDYQDHAGLSIQYGIATLKEKEYCLYNSDVLEHIGKPSLELGAQGTGTAFKLFNKNESDEFDLIAACFFLLSRAEEYGTIQTDRHGRYDGRYSILVKHDILEIPIVDHWIRDLSKNLGLFFNKPFKLKQPDMNWTIGVDIDHFYKHRHKPVLKKIGGSLLQLIKGQYREFNERIGIYYGSSPDPYDSYNIIQKQVPAERLIYFILAGGTSPYDKNQSISVGYIARKLKEIKNYCSIGIHPSYYAGSFVGLLSKEKSVLEQHTGQEIKQSRFHYLKFSYPESFRILIQEGLRADYSLGYPDRAGFRAGTCHSFYWFDLEKNIKTDLIQYPFAIMDRTLKDHLMLDGHQAVEKIKKLFETCQLYGGQFHMVWHNSSFDFKGEWTGWQNTFSEALAYFKKIRNS